MSINAKDYAKAFSGAVLAALGAAKLALGDDVITAAEWVDIAYVALAAFGLVWAIPNSTTDAAGNKVGGL